LPKGHEMKKRFSFIFLGLFMLSGCNPGKIFEKYYDIDRITWNRFDVKTFQFDIDDTSSGYDFFAVIRHHTDIPFRFIDIRFIINTPSGETRIMEQKILIRDKEGKLLGEGMGDLWDIMQPVRQDFRFNEPGKCTVEISSAMSQADLPGVLQVGLVVRKSQ
jgi:gliding motility-associated lipoprotein GldH